MLKLRRHLEPKTQQIKQVYYTRSARGYSLLVAHPNLCAKFGLRPFFFLPFPLFSFCFLGTREATPPGAGVNQ